MKKLLLLFIFTFLIFQGWATHIRGGNISVKRISSLVCDVTVTLFTDSDCTGCPTFGSELDVLDFGDGSQVYVPSGFSNSGTALYTIRHTFPGIGRYTISYREPSRSGGVLNMINAASTNFYIETIIDFDPIAGFSSTPEFLMAPIFQTKLGANFSLSAGGVSEDDNILYYELGTPLSDRGNPVLNYQLPENIQINPFNGLITWDTKFNGQYQTGEFLFNVKVHMYKEVGGVKYKTCTITREIQILVVESSSGEMNISSDMETDENGRVYLPVNESKTIKVFFETLTTQSNIDLTAYSELADNPAVFSFSSYDSATAENIKVCVLTLTAASSIDRENPYLISIRGGLGEFASDISYLLYTRDLQPEVITGAEDDQGTIEMYPNPANDFITISLAENHEGLIYIHDHTGMLILMANVVGTSSLDIRHLSRGLYYCSIVSGTITKKLKLVKN